MGVPPGAGRVPGVPACPHHGLPQRAVTSVEPPNRPGGRYPSSAAEYPASWPGAGRSWPAGSPRAFRPCAATGTSASAISRLPRPWAASLSTSASRSVTPSARSWPGSSRTARPPSRDRRPGPAQQFPAGGRHPVIAARGEETGCLAQPGSRLTPAIGEGRLGGHPPGVVPVPGHQRAHLRVRRGERGRGVSSRLPSRPARMASAYPSRAPTTRCRVPCADRTRTAASPASRSSSAPSSGHSPRNGGAIVAGELSRSSAPVVIWAWASREVARPAARTSPGSAPSAQPSTSWIVRGERDRFGDPGLHGLLLAADRVRGGLEDQRHRQRGQPEPARRVR